MKFFERFDPVGLNILMIVMSVALSSFAMGFALAHSLWCGR